MADQRDEKFDEKEMEKREEKSSEEKSWEEKGRRDPVSAIIWAILLIYAGAILLMNNLGYLDAWLGRIAAALNLPFIADLPVWSVILIGAGFILLVEVIIRLALPEYRHGVGGTVVLAVILLAVGLGNQIGWNLVLPLILIGVGLSILLRGMIGRR